MPKIDSSFALFVAALAAGALLLALLRSGWRVPQFSCFPSRRRPPRMEQSRLEAASAEVVAEIERSATRLLQKIEGQRSALERLSGELDLKLARYAELSRTEAPAAPASVEARLAPAASYPPAPPCPAPPAASAAPATPLCARVYGAAECGGAPMTIAEKLNMMVGEVEVALNLREFR